MKQVGIFQVGIFWVGVFQGWEEFPGGSLMGENFPGGNFLGGEFSQNPAKDHEIQGTIPEMRNPLVKLHAYAISCSEEKFNFYINLKIKT